MDLVAIWGIAAPTVALIVGGLFGRRKTKADAHSIVVTDATTFGNMMLQRAERAEQRLDALEVREQQRDALARNHLRWDWRQVRRLADLGIEVEDPPALFLYDEGSTKGN